jgi:hypothetical protein
VPSQVSERMQRYVNNKAFQKDQDNASAANRVER